MTSNSKLLAFFEGSGVPYKISDILSWPLKKWEDTHDYIQWIFPCSQPSEFNSDAPVLTPEDAKAILTDHMETFAKLVVGFLHFLYMTKALDRPSHNDLRVTRLITSIREIGLSTEYVLEDIHSLQPKGNPYWTKASSVECLWQKEPTTKETVYDFQAPEN